MSPKDLASQELAVWCKYDNQNQLDMIDKSDLNMEAKERQRHRDLYLGIPTIPNTPKHSGNGKMSMPGVASFQMAFAQFSGDAVNIGRESLFQLNIIKKVSADTVWDNINKAKRTDGIVCIGFAPYTDDDEYPYNTVFKHLNTRKQLGAINLTSPAIEAFYILPLASHESVPSVLLPMSARTFEPNRPDILLGIIVRKKRTSPIVAKPPATPKVFHRGHKNKMRLRTFQRYVIFLFTDGSLGTKND